MESRRVSIVPRGESIDPEGLAGLGLFQDLQAEVLERLARLLHRQTFAPNTTLMTAGQSGEAVYILLSGTVKVHIEQAGGETF